MKSIQNIRYTVRHRKAFRIVEKKLLGHNTFRGYVHDLDKVFLLIFLPKKTVHKLHQAYVRHHVNMLKKTHSDYVEMVIDWECARFTKPDKPLTACETLEKFYPQLTDAVTPVLKELSLNDAESSMQS